MVYCIIALVVSLSLNVFLVYQRLICLEELEYHEENRSALFDNFAGYKTHLESIFELPMFYGDSTLENLIEHTKEMALLVGEYEELHDDDLEEGPLEAPSTEEE